MDGRRRAAISRQARVTTARYLERSGVGGVIAGLASEGGLDLKVV
jgi:phage shock protein PspC (stress-responsive transcriptional regulator)